MAVTAVRRIQLQYQDRVPCHSELMVKVPSTWPGASTGKARK